MHNERELGVVGLGRIGGSLAMQALEKGMRVVGVDPGGIGEELVDAGLMPGSSFEIFREYLGSPRAVFVYVPAGSVVDDMLEGLADALDVGDVVIDGGNSYWGDSVRRHERLAGRGIHLVDLGTSGGIEGARHGACFMAGGDSEAVARVEPILKDLAVAGGYVNAGPPGAGHYVKLVHNGIEFGMLQAIGEGVDLLERYGKPLPVADVLQCWRHGSVIRSWLIDLMESEYRRQGGVSSIPSHVEDTGEVNWLIADALEMERPIPAIAHAVMQLLASRDDAKGSARAVAMMRHAFGGHPYGEDPGVRKERRKGRVGDIWRNR